MVTHVVYRSSSSGTPPTVTTTKNSPLTLVEGDSNLKAIVDSIDSKAPVLSPTFTGSPAAPTPTAGNSSTKIATTEFVTTAISPLSTMSYVNSAISALASTAFVNSAIETERSTANTLTNKTILNPAGFIVTLTDAPTTNWNMDLGQVAIWNITAAGRILGAPTSYKSGVIYTLFIQLANPTTMNPNWPANFKFQYDIAPDLSTSTITILSLIWSPLHSKFCVFPAPGL